MIAFRLQTTLEKHSYSTAPQLKFSISICLCPDAWYFRWDTADSLQNWVGKHAKYKECKSMKFWKTAWTTSESCQSKTKIFFQKKRKKSEKKKTHHGFKCWDRIEMENLNRFNIYFLSAHLRVTFFQIMKVKKCITNNWYTPKIAVFNTFRSVKAQDKTKKTGGVKAFLFFFPA